MKKIKLIQILIYLKLTLNVLIMVIMMKIGFGVVMKLVLIMMENGALKMQMVLQLLLKVINQIQGT